MHDMVNIEKEGEEAVDWEKTDALSQNDTGKDILENPQGSKTIYSKPLKCIQIKYYSHIFISNHYWK